LVVVHETLCGGRDVGVDFYGSLEDLQGHVAGHLEGDDVAVRLVGLDNAHGDAPMGGLVSVSFSRTVEKTAEKHNKPENSSHLARESLAGVAEAVAGQLVSGSGMTKPIKQIEQRRLDLAQPAGPDGRRLGMLEDSRSLLSLCSGGRIAGLQGS
jgi:hypothetical protein